MTDPGFSSLNPCIIYTAVITCMGLYVAIITAINKLTRMPASSQCLGVTLHVNRAKNMRNVAFVVSSF